MFIKQSNTYRDITKSSEVDSGEPKQIHGHYDSYFRKEFRNQM